MNLKTDILTELKNSTNYVSGQTLALKYNVSRNAIWKSISALKNEGYIIDSITNKGYKLISDNVISTSEIHSLLGLYSSKITICFFNTVESTNTTLKSLYENGADEHTIVISNCQTNGRGRFGREFYSPFGTGVYFSLLLKPDCEMSESTLITSMTGVSICKAIESLTMKHPGIKWMNDIYIEDKKIAGILTEASSDFESGMIHYLIIGIGINISTETFPPEISEKAGSIGENISKNLLIAEIIKNFYDMYYKLPNADFIEDYRNYSIMLNKTITYRQKNKTRTGIVTGINDAGGLIVRNSGGNISTLTSGEVTILSF